MWKLWPLMWIYFISRKLSIVRQKKTTNYNSFFDEKKNAHRTWNAMFKHVLPMMILSWFTNTFTDSTVLFLLHFTLSMFPEICTLLILVRIHVHLVSIRSEIMKLNMHRWWKYGKMKENSHKCIQVVCITMVVHFHVLWSYYDQTI